MKKRKIIICRGIQSSGKSTWSRKWVEESPKSRIRYNNDDIRNMLGPYWIPEREPLVTRIKGSLLREAMTKGYDIALDNMNLNPKEIDWINSLIATHNDDWREDKTDFFYEAEFKNFFIPVEECIRRDSLRPNPIGEKVIKETWRRYRDFIISETNRIYQASLLKQDPSLPKAVIVDMDATLCFNTSGRPFYGEGCAEGIEKDVPNEAVCSLVRAMFSDMYKIIIITGREGTKKITEATEKWLKDHDIVYDEIHFREEKDYSKGDVCKRKIYDKYIKDKYNVCFVIDDSQKCVDMYRELGLICLQPNDGTF